MLERLLALLVVVCGIVVAATLASDRAAPPAESGPDVPPASVDTVAASPNATVAPSTVPTAGEDAASASSALEPQLGALHVSVGGHGKHKKGHD